MSPLEMKGYRKDAGDFVHHALFEPGESGRITNNLPNGEKELYRFSCLPDGSKSVIEKSKRGFGIAFAGAGQPLSAGHSLEWTLVRELRRGEFFDIQVITDFNPNLRTVRFEHK